MILTVLLFVVFSILTLPRDSGQSLADYSMLMHLSPFLAYPIPREGEGDEKVESFVGFRKGMTTKLGKMHSVHSQCNVS